MLHVMKDLASQGWTMVVVTHEIRFAQQVSDQVLFMDGGVIVERGTPAEVLTQPRTERARQFPAPHPRPVLSLLVRLVGCSRALLRAANNPDPARGGA